MRGISTAANSIPPLSETLFGSDTWCLLRWTAQGALKDLVAVWQDRVWSWPCPYGNGGRPSGWGLIEATGPRGGHGAALARSPQVSRPTQPDTAKGILLDMCRDFIGQNQGSGCLYYSHSFRFRMVLKRHNPRDKYSFLERGTLGFVRAYLTQR